MIEKQAKKKWCPIVRVGVKPEAGGPDGINEPDTQLRGNCIGSDCAMWRWIGPVPSNPEGFCGLAGKPAFV